jgi:hypothetical protein
MLYLTSTLLFANAFAPYQKNILFDFLYEISSRKNPDPERSQSILLPGAPLRVYPSDMTEKIQKLLNENPIGNFGLFGSIPDKIEKLTKRLGTYADTLFIQRESQDKENKFKSRSLKQAMEAFLEMYPEYQKPDPELKPQGFVSNKAAERLLKLMVQIIRIEQAIVPPSKQDQYKELTANTSNARGVAPEDKHKIYEYDPKTNSHVLKKEVPYSELEKLSKDQRYHQRSPEKALWDRFLINGLTGSINIHTTIFNNLKSANFHILNFVPIYERMLSTPIELNDYSLLMGLSNPTSTFMSQQQMIGAKLEVWPFPNIRVHQVLLSEGYLSPFVHQATPEKAQQLFSQSYLNPFRIVEAKRTNIPIIGRVMGYYLSNVFNAISHRLPKKIEKLEDLKVKYPWKRIRSGLKFTFEVRKAGVDLYTPLEGCSYLPFTIWVKECPLSQADNRSQSAFRAVDSIKRAMEILGFNPEKIEEIPLKSRKALTTVWADAEVFYLPYAPKKERKTREKYAGIFLQKVLNKTKSKRKKDLKAFFNSEEFKQLKEFYKSFEPKVFETLEALKDPQDKLILLTRLEQDQTLRAKFLCELYYQDTGKTFIGNGLTFTGQRQDIWIQPFLNGIQHLALQGFKKIYELKCFPVSVPKDVRKIWTALVEMIKDNEEEKKRHDPSVLERFSIKKWEVCYSSILSLIPILHFEKTYGVSKQFEIQEHLAPLPSLFKTKEDEIKISKGKLTPNLNAGAIFDKLLNQFQTFFGTPEDHLHKETREHWLKSLQKFFGASFNLLNKKTYIFFLDWVLQNEVHLDLLKTLRINLKNLFASFLKKLSKNWSLIDDDYFLLIRETEEDREFEDLENWSFFNTCWVKKEGEEIEVDLNSWEEGKMVPVFRTEVF